MSPQVARGLRLDQRQRVIIAALLGGVACTVSAFFAPWQLSVLVGWDVTALFVVISVWSFLPFLDARSTEQVATREDVSRAIFDFVMVVACAISLVGVVAGLAYSRGQSGPMRWILLISALFTVFLSWFTVHTLFALRYARLFYSQPVGGIDFPRTDDPPDYLDFVYVALTVGMTFQVSDTGIGQRSIRRAVIRHAILSYIFGTAIVGVAINVVGTLVGSS